MIRARDAARAILIGALVGGTGWAFRTLATELLAGMRLLVAWLQAGVGAVGAALALGVALAAVLAAVAALVQRFAPEAAGSGIQEIEATLDDKRRLRAVPVLLAKFIGGVVALGSGLPLGREGPTVHMGGAIGELVHSSRKDPRAKERRNLAISAGAAAGLAAAFNAPLSGIVLILEEMRRQFRFSAHGLQFVALATLAADVVVRVLSGGEPVLQLGEFTAPSMPSMFLFLALGGACGVWGALLSRGLILSVDRLGLRRLGLLAPALTGLLVGALWLGFPTALGDGYEVIGQALHGSLTLSALVLIIVVRSLATTIAFSSGVPGGVFAPLVTLGILIGCVAAPLAEASGADVTALQLAVAGIGAMFAAVVHAPITGIVLSIELTGALDASLPLLAATLGATVTSRLCGGLPLYEELADRLPDLPD